MGGRFRRAAVRSALLVVLAAAAAGAAPEPFARIVLVTIDTLRADHLSCYGYPRRTSPFLDGLCARGVVFDRAYAPMPTTAPSHATLFTSRHPLQHRLLANGMRLAPGVPTLAERLSAAGFRTAGFTSTHAHWSPSDLDRGFGDFGARPEAFGSVYRQAHATVEAALRWLRRCGDCERAFLFVHLFDPHAPLRPPREHLAAIRAGTDEERARHVAFLREQHGLPLAFYGDDPDRMLSVVDRYDAEIRFADAELRRLYDAVSALPGETLWIVTSDHGEGLGNHRFMGHGKAYEEGLRVPLVFHGSGGSLAARRVGALVSHVDVAPTALALAGVAPDASGEGRSLRPLLLGERMEPRAGVFAQRGAIADGPQVRRLPGEDPGDLSGDQYAWIEPRWKYLHHESGDDELYDLDADPHEMRNLLASGEVPQQAARLRAVLLGRLAELSARRADPPPPPDLDEHTREELRALGYLP